MATPSPSDLCVSESVKRAAVEVRRAYVGGTYWWSHAAVRGIFSGPAGHPRFHADIDAAIAEAHRDTGQVIAWATRVEPHHEAVCTANGITLVRIEDGFIRSVGLGAGFAKAASLAVDGRGMHYDATRPSDIEDLLQHAVLTTAQRAEGARIRARIVELGLSKYNLRAAQPLPVAAGGRKILLVPGQVADDASVMGSMAATIDVRSGENINLQLLRQVRARNPDAYIIYKPHPDVLSGLRKGALTANEMRGFADLVLTHVDITGLIDLCDGLETISSLAGFEALLRGKDVTTHGVPFYAGWGLTTDLTPAPRRTARRGIDELCYIAFVLYTRHVHPRSGRPCTVHELLDALSRLRGSRLFACRTRLLEAYARLCERRAT